MASWKQLQNLRKCKNQFRHNWIDDGIAEGKGETYCYTCKKCRKKKIKASTYSSVYYGENGNYIGRTAPECVG